MAPKVSVVNITSMSLVKGFGTSLITAWKAAGTSGILRQPVRVMTDNGWFNLKRIDDLNANHKAETMVVVGSGSFDASSDFDQSVRWDLELHDFIREGTMLLATN